MIVPATDKTNLLKLLGMIQNYLWLYYGYIIIL